MEILEKLRKAHIHVTNLIAGFRREENDAMSVRSTVSHQSNGNQKRIKPKLPTLELQKFDGDPLKWQSFWDRFTSSIHSDDDISNVDKFTYLLSYLSGSALRVVDGLEVTNSQHENAVQILTQRFGDKEKVVASHFERIMELKVASNKTSDLRLFFDEIEKHIRCLRACGLKDEEFAKTFVPIVRLKLPPDVKLELSRKKGDGAWDLDSLRRLLNDEIVARESCMENFETKYSKKETGTIPKDIPTKLTTTSALVSPQNRQKKCGFCGDHSHYSDQCKKFPDLESRKKQLGSNRCWTCLRVGHNHKSCQAQIKCYYCNKKHHSSLCPDKFRNRNEKESGGPAAKTPPAKTEPTLTAISTHRRQTVALLAQHQTVIMPTAVATIENDESKRKRSTTCRLIFDSGSHRSYITGKVAKRLNLRPTRFEKLEVGVFGSNSTNVVRALVNNVRIKMLSGAIVEMTVNVVPTISISIHKAKIDVDKHTFLKNLTLAEPLNDLAEDFELDMLIGSDFYNEIVGGKKIEVEKGLYLTDTLLGWVLSGRISTTAELSGNSSTLLAPVVGTPVDAALEKFWKLESIGIHESGEVEADDFALKKFNDTITFENGRYMVSWPWKNSDPDLPENYELALGRLKSLEKRLSQQTEIVEQYEETLKKQLAEGVIEKVVPGTMPEGTRKHYLPHHAVLKEDSTSTKLRVVYDASAKARKNANSLNDCLYRGPVLLENLCGILLRFRSNPIGMLSDVEKAFLQLGLHEDDRDVMRFLWFESDGNLTTFRFTRVPFGIISSPFLLEATVAHHLKTVDSELANKISKNLYVDNVCLGADTVDEAVLSYTFSKSIFKTASMNLRQWSSNSKELMHRIPLDDQLIDEKTKLLGLAWDLDSDSLRLMHSASDTKGTLTKRKLLASISSIYDPLGLFSPVTVRAKIFIQNLWKLKLDWDIPVSGSLEREWTDLTTDLRFINELTVSRFVGIKNNLRHENVKIEIHCFCDSSASAYAAAVYLCVSQNDEIRTSLKFSKTRLAPIKTLTIPRLELLGVLLGTRLMRFVEKELEITPVKKIVWSDSKCVLAWILGKKLKTPFVENRLKEIRLDKDIKFRYVSTMENPADIPTRGSTAVKLKTNLLWWEGPVWPKPDTFDSTNFDSIEERKTPLFVAALATLESINSFSRLLNESSSLNWVLRVTAHVLRAVSRFKKRQSETDCIKANELTQARRAWDKMVQNEMFSDLKTLLSKGLSNGFIKQLNLYIDESGLIRCRGRLAYSDIVDSAKNPILLPKSHRYVDLLIENVHRNLSHAGIRHILSELRQNYWIPSARRVIKKSIRDCFVCLRWEGGPFQPPPPPSLPKERVTAAPPFTFVGVDFLGPLHIKTGKKDVSKVWICLFTCAVTRAIHLELAPTMSGKDFIEILRSFVARRGKPNLIILDNAPQFRFANSVLHKIWSGVVCNDSVQNYVANEGIRWKFIVELSPWMGGFYERLVGLTKRSLRKTINGRLIHFRELETILIEVEAVINSRPLAFIGSEIDDSIILTPALFLHSGGRAGFPDLGLDEDDPDFTTKIDSATNLIEIWKAHQTLLDQFWKRFRDDYLLSLRERALDNKIRNAVPQVPRLGQAVLIKENLPRGQWRAGVVKKLVVSPDGSVRSVVVRTKNGKKFNRSVSFLYPLELVSGDETEELVEETLDRNGGGNRDIEEGRLRTTRSAAAKAKSAISELFRRECRAEDERELESND